MYKTVHDIVIGNVVCEFRILNSVFLYHSRRVILLNTKLLVSKICSGTVVVCNCLQECLGTVMVYKH